MRLTAGIPALILGLLHKRQFLHVDYEGCLEWHEILRRWRLQDRVIWIVGLGYIVVRPWLLPLAVFKPICLFMYSLPLQNKNL